MPDRMTRDGLARRLPAGVIDAVFASLATFATGLVAVNILDDGARGAYGVLFTAFVVGAAIPAQLVLIPAEVVATRAPPARRLATLGRSLWLGTIPGLGSLPLFAIAAMALRGASTTDALTALVVTAALATLLSPLQDHVRRMFHIADESWKAAAVSGVQLITVGTALLVMLGIDVETAWVPFGALLAGNVVSLASGVALARIGSPNATRERSMRLADLAATGRWLLATNLVPHASAFVAALIVEQLVGPEPVGFAAAARVAAQPWFVLAVGLTAVLRPRLIEAGAARDGSTARVHRRLFLRLMIPAGGVYFAWAAAPWAGNPLYFLVPAAYDVSGLVAVSVMASAAQAATRLLTGELLGARAERTMAMVSLFAVPAYLSMAALAPLTEAFAIPLGVLTASGGIAIAYAVTLRRYYAR